MKAAKKTNQELKEQVKLRLVKDDSTVEALFKERELELKLEREQLEFEKEKLLNAQWDIEYNDLNLLQGGKE